MLRRGDWCDEERSVGAEGIKEGKKLRVFNAMVVPTLLYRCEAWTVQKGHKSRMQACEMMCL